MIIEHDKSDSEILSLSLTEPSAFAVLVDRYQKDFLRKVEFILKNKEEAQDVVQDTFVKIYLNAKRFKVQEGATFKSWGYKILLNTCFTYCKKKKREKLFFENTPSEDLDLYRAHDETEDRLDLDLVKRVIARIPQALGNILTLNLLHGKSYETIAEDEGVTMGAIRTRMHRAKKEFKKEMNQYAK